MTETRATAYRPSIQRARGRDVPDLETVLRRALLAVALVLACLLGFAASYVITLLVLIQFVYFLVQRRTFVIDLPARAFFFSFLAMGVAFAVGAKHPMELIYLVNFASFLNFAVLSTGYRPAASPANSKLVADLALLGTALGCAFAVIDRVMLGAERAGRFTTDPIRLADTALILGFLCLMGILARKDARRWVYLLGPVLALITIFMSGSRGALLAFTPMVIAAAFLLMRHKLMAIGVGAAILAVFALLFSFTDLLGARFASLPAILADLGNGAVIADEAARIRFELYKAGWAAFQDFPLFGHGWARMMSSVAPYLSEADKIHAGLPHLHNEALNFAVSGGLVGVLVYLVLLALPIASCLATPRDSQFRARLYGCSLLTVSYFMLGLPDTMLSFELHSSLYVALSAILLAYCRDPEAAR